jgi:hypothetical protein
MTPYREAAPRTKRPYVAPAIVAESGPWHGHAYILDFRAREEMTRELPRCFARVPIERRERAVTL